MFNIFALSVDGSGAAKQLTNREYWPWPTAMSPDGRTLVYTVQHPVTSYDLWTLDLATGREATLIAGPFDQPYADFSPDGHWIVYASNDSGRYEVYVQHFPLTGRRWSISRNGGNVPRWSRNGRELFFRNGNKMMVADVSTKPSLEIGAPKMLFEGDYAPEYDVSPDGERFVMIANRHPASESQLNVILGATADIARRVDAAGKHQ
jgi:eukaryotic-like serine/threonine-protein kinase